MKLEKERHGILAARYDQRQSSLYGAGHEQELRRNTMKKNTARTRKSGNKAVASAKTAQLLQTRVVATNKAREMRPSSFFGKMAAKAAKPVEMARLIALMKSSATIRSKKDNSAVAHTKVRDAFTRLGLLKKVA